MTLAGGYAFPDYIKAVYFMHKKGCFRCYFRFPKTFSLNNKGETESLNSLWANMEH